MRITPRVYTLAIDVHQSRCPWEVSDSTANTILSHSMCSVMLWMASLVTCMFNYCGGQRVQEVWKSALQVIVGDRGTEGTGSVEESLASYCGGQGDRGYRKCGREPCKLLWGTGGQRVQEVWKRALQVIVGDRGTEGTGSVEESLASYCGGQGDRGYRKCGREPCKLLWGTGGQRVQEVWKSALQVIVGDRGTEGTGSVEESLASYCGGQGDRGYRKCGRAPCKLLWGTGGQRVQEVWKSALQVGCNSFRLE